MKSKSWTWEEREVIIKDLLHSATHSLCLGLSRTLRSSTTGVCVETEHFILKITPKMNDFRFQFLLNDSSLFFSFPRSPSVLFSLFSVLCCYSCGDGESSPSQDGWRGTNFPSKTLDMEEVVHLHPGWRSFPPHLVSGRYTDRSSWLHRKSDFIPSVSCICLR